MEPGTRLCVLIGWGEMIVTNQLPSDFRRGPERSEVWALSFEAKHWAPAWVDA
jgi:hypothetical protein